MRLITARCAVLCMAVFLTFGSPLHATIFGRVQGIVHDPQHRPMAGASVKLQAITSDWSQTAQTDDNGEFSFTTVPVGDYKITVTQSKFETSEQTVTVVSGSSPILHFQLAIAAMNQSTVVVGQAEAANMDSVTPTTLVDREDIAQTPGADRTNSMAMITDYVPGRLRNPRHAAHARRPSGRLADRRRAHTQHQYRHQSGSADRPQGHRLSRNSAGQLRCGVRRPHLWDLQYRAPHRLRARQ